MQRKAIKKAKIYGIAFISEFTVAFDKWSNNNRISPYKKIQ